MPTSLEETKRQVARNRRKGKRVAKKNSSLGTELYKLVCLVLGVVMLVAFFPSKSTEVNPDVSYAMPMDVDKSQGKFVENYLAYSREIGHSGGLGGRTQVDLSDVYVDAEGVVPASLGATIDTDSGTPIAVNGPTRELTEFAYVVNIEKLAEWMYQDIIDSETARGITPTKTAQECAREKLSGGLLFSKENATSTDSLAGAVGPAIVHRDYIANHRWTEGAITNASVHWQAFPNKDSSEAYIDIMFVPIDDVDKYYAGEETTVYYVSWRVNDVKAHSAPWGLAQTNIHFSYDGPKTQFAFIDGRYGTAGYGDTDYVATSARTDDAGVSFHNLVLEYLNQSLPTYRAPAVSATASDLNNPMYVGLQEIFEYRENEHWTSFQKWYSQMKESTGLVCVGVLVYATEDYTPEEMSSDAP